MRLGVATVVRDEARLIAEWIAHYAFQGFDRILIYDNGSSDETVSIISKAARSTPVTLVDWSHRTDPGYQCAAYDDALRLFGADVEWMLFADADEFIAPGKGESVRSVLSPLQDAAAVGVNWAIFGSGGRVSPSQGLVVESYLTRARRDFTPNQHVKSFVRPSLCKGFVNCYMAEVSGPFLNPLGEPIQWLSEGISASVTGFERLRLNHYFVRSREDWAFKISRGYRDIVRDQNIFTAYDQNGVYDNGLEREALLLKNLYGFVSKASPDYVWRSPDGLPPSFSPERYLELNPDVAASGMTAEFHWRHHGAAEGRPY